MDQLVLDAWTPIGYKDALGDERFRTNQWQAPRWVGGHARRLEAYKILLAYLKNASRMYLATDDQNRKKEHREYGDADTIIETICDAVLGDDQKYVVDGVETGDARAQLLQDWLIQWVEDEKFKMHLLETEADAVGLGDGVYVLSWSNAKKRPRIQSYDPGFYFPVLDETDRAEQDYPSKVHIAWEEPAPEPGKIFVRRITWELAPIMPQLNFDGNVIFEEGTLNPLLFPGDQWLPGGAIVRSLPWRESPAQMTCYLTDAVWQIDVLNNTINDFNGATVTYNINEDGQLLNRLDLRIDFVPVIHVPNTPSVREHYGRSSLSMILQILDDIMSTDTDLQAASATTGTPPIVTKGGMLERDEFGRIKNYGPGTVWDTENGVDVIDTSRSLDALLKLLRQLLERLSTNSRVPDSVLGRIKPSEVPSGVALAMSFGPLQKMVRKMRLVRDDKYPTLIKFAFRLAMLGGAIPQGELPPARIEWGSFLPSDKQTTVSNVTMLLQNNAVSLETAIQMLIEAGFPIQDAGVEVERIRTELQQKQEQAMAVAQARQPAQPPNPQGSSDAAPPRPPGRRANS